MNSYGKSLVGYGRATAKLRHNIPGKEQKPARSQTVSHIQHPSATSATAKSNLRPHAHTRAQGADTGERVAAVAAVADGAGNCSKVSSFTSLAGALLSQNATLVPEFTGLAASSVADNPNPPCPGDITERSAIVEESTGCTRQEALARALSPFGLSGWALTLANLHKAAVRPSVAVLESSSNPVVVRLAKVTDAFLASPWFETGGVVRLGDGRTVRRRRGQPLRS
jgi:hypothetical protein